MKILERPIVNGICHLDQDSHSWGLIVVVGLGWPYGGGNGRC